MGMGKGVRATIWVVVGEAVFWDSGNFGGGGEVQ